MRQASLDCKPFESHEKKLTLNTFSAPPDRGLALRQMSGKKEKKTRITVALACNADGSEKLEPVFIGKFKQPRCFRKRPATQLGLYYRNNRTSWMTAVLFEE